MGAALDPRRGPDFSRSCPRQRSSSRGSTESPVSGDFRSTIPGSTRKSRGTSRTEHPLLAIYAIGLPVALSPFRDQSRPGKRYILHVIPFGAILAAHGFADLSR